MKILMTGSSGLVGTAAGAQLRKDGHIVCPLVRLPRVAGPGEAVWDPETGALDSAAAAGAEAVVNLGGASIGEGRWSESRKQLLRSSRIDATRNLVNALGQLDPRPHVLVSASAIGYYGNRGDESLMEDSQPGNDFLANLVRDWEEESLRAATHGIRVVILRFGIVLSRRGGALAQMLGPFQMGVGGRLGSGKHWMSWIALEDVAEIISRAVSEEKWKGIYNAVSPEPVTNAGFTRALGKVLHRPTLFPAPRAALRLLLGEMADGMVLASQRVLPRKLLDQGYSYLYPDLEPALSVALTHR